MQTTVNVVCYKSKTLSNGEHPLMIRLCQGRKLKYISIGISIHPQYWDFEKNKPRRNCPNKDQIQKIITDKTTVYKEQVLDFKTTNKEFTVSSLAEKVHSPQQATTVNDLFKLSIDRLKIARRTGYALSVQQVYNSLLEYNQHLDIYFSDIDVVWLKQYELHLRSKELSDNTIAIRFRTLRAIYNTAVEERIVKPEYYPFKNYKVSKLIRETPKRSITKSDVEAIISYRTEHEYTIFAIDLFLFTYLMGGINFVDIAYLTRDNIIDDRLIYSRRKTGKLIKLPLQDKAIELIDKYRQFDNPYLFPIFSKFHRTDQQKANRVHKVITKVNKYLKAVGEELGLPIDLTTYVARHKQSPYQLLINKLHSLRLEIGNDLETSLLLRYA